MKLSLKKINKLNVAFLVFGFIYCLGISSTNFVFWQKEIAFLFPLQAFAIAYIFWFNRGQKNKS